MDGCAMPCDVRPNTVAEVNASAEKFFREACEGMGTDVTDVQVAKAVKELSKHILAVRPDIKRH
jgi:hypothetical protein